MHFSTVAKSLSLTKSHSHSHEDSSASESKSLEPHKINRLNSVEDFEQTLIEHHHRRVIVFCVTSTYKDPDVDEEGWYHHYEKLHDVHFVRLDLDVIEELEEKLKPKVKPCWFSFHKGVQTGWSSGGMKRFIETHSDRKDSH